MKDFRLLNDAIIQKKEGKKPYIRKFLTKNRLFEFYSTISTTKNYHHNSETDNHSPAHNRISYANHHPQMLK